VNLAGKNGKCERERCERERPRDRDKEGKGRVHLFPFIQIQSHVFAARSTEATPRRLKCLNSFLLLPTTTSILALLIIPPFIILWRPLHYIFFILSFQILKFLKSEGMMDAQKAEILLLKNKQT
jgi:hypothetical protein